jgi:hypothetical protein
VRTFLDKLDDVALPLESEDFGVSFDSWSVKELLTYDFFLDACVSSLLLLELLLELVEK